MKKENCPTCGAKVDSIFDHVDGCVSDVDRVKLNVVSKFKKFTVSDLKNGRIWLQTPYPNVGELISLEANYGQTATGYGEKMPSDLMIYFEGRLRRIYITCCSNAESSWFIYKGEKIHVLTEEEFDKLDDACHG